MVLAIIEVVVVLPWVPATAMPRFMLHELRQHLGPLVDGNATFDGRHQFRVMCRDGGRDHHGVGPVQILSRVADGDGDPAFFQHARVTRALQIGTADLVYPSVWNTWAMPLMPAPPMPIK